MKLSRPGVTQTQAPQAEATAQQERPMPKGWGAPAANSASIGTVETTQRERIQEQINPEANRAMFSQSVQQQAEAIRSGAEPIVQAQAEEPAPKTTRTRRAAAEPSPAANDDAVKQMVAALAADAGTKYLRLKAVEIAAGFKDNFEATDDLYTLADEVLAWINKAA